MIEMLMFIGILALIISFGLFLSIDFYKGYAFHYEKNLLISALQTARSRAMGNINRQPHGVYFENGNYIIFQGTGYDANDPNNQKIPATQAVNVWGFPLQGIVFKQLSGEVDNSSIINLSFGASSGIVEINNQGRINW